MQKEGSESSFSLSQRAYLIADSFREGTKVLLSIYGLLVFYILIGVYSFFYEDNPRALVELLLLFFILTTPFLVWYVIKILSFNRQLKQWNIENLHNTYILIFDTTVPKGNSTGEKILDLARMVFPELREEDYIRFSINYMDHIRYFFRKRLGKPKEEIISRSLGYKLNSDYSLELALKTFRGYFIVKEFKDKVVTVDDLRHLTSVLQKRFKTRLGRTNIFQVICVAKEYDESFLNRDSLEAIMLDELDANFDIDLIIHENIGYSVLWIS